jgi:hypothetical protein
VLLNRKLIRCPICKDENKYFVNISDHLIKIHHLISSDSRKPFLKAIKQNASLYVTANVDPALCGDCTPPSSLPPVNDSIPAISSVNNAFKPKKSSKLASLYNKRKSSTTPVKLNDKRIKYSLNRNSQAYFEPVEPDLEHQIESSEDNLDYIDKLIAEDSLLNANNDDPNQQTATLDDISKDAMDNILYTNNNANLDENSNNGTTRSVGKKNSLFFLLQQRKSSLKNGSVLPTAVDTPPSSSSSQTSDNRSNYAFSSNANIGANPSDQMNKIDEVNESFCTEKNKNTVSGQMDDNLNNQSSLDSIGFELTDNQASNLGN